MLSDFFSNGTRIPLTAIKTAQTGTITSMGSFNFPWWGLSITIGQVNVSKTMLVHNIHCSNTSGILKWHYGYDPDSTAIDGITNYRCNLTLSNSTTLRVEGFAPNFNGTWYLFEFY